MDKLDTLEDFLDNESFRAWLHNPTPESDNYWQKWLETHPHKKEHFEMAVSFLLALEGAKEEISDEYVTAKADAIVTDLADDTPQQFLIDITKRPFFRWVAVIVLGLGIGWFYNQSDSPATYLETIAVADNPGDHPMVKILNPDQKPALVNLPDGSSVLLSQGSTMEYNQDGPFERKVYLTGEAFFEVVKNPEAPFFVHTDKLTTKVLGTSFRVRSFAEETEAQVSVRTGTVTVTAHRSQHHNQDSETIIVHHNEQVNLNNNDQQLIKSVIPSSKERSFPEVLQKENWEFRFTSLQEVFSILENAYGVSIDYDQDKMKNCTLTASLADEPFMDKIRLICIGIDAEFSIENEKVIITGKGCEPDKRR